MRTEVRRGRKFIEYTDDSLPKGMFVQDISGADVSYQDEAGKWNPLDEGWETDGKDGFSFRASRMNHKVRFDSAGAWRWYPRRNVDTEYIAINRPECWLPATNRRGNLLVNGISRDGKDITLSSVRNVTRVIHSRWNGIKTDWILENDKAPTHYRQKIDLVGITEKDGVLYGEDGTELARLMPTTAKDANGKELPCEGTYADGYLDFSVDTSGAAYPVTLDPDFAGAAADGYIYGNNSSYSTARSTSSAFDNTSDLLYLGQLCVISKFYRIYRGFLKFDTSSLPDNATITQVNLKLVCTTNKSGTDFDVQIVKQNWSSQDPLSDTNREAAYDNCLSGTADSSIWRNTNGIDLNTQYASGNLATDWVNKTGNTYYSLRSSLDYANTTPTGDEYIYIASADNTTSSYRPVLTVTYTTSTAYTLTCSTGSYALTGTSATLEVKRNYTLACNAGSYAITGTAASFVVHRNFTAQLAGGSYVLTGTNASFVLQRNYVLACGAGSYTLTGSTCAFTVLRNYMLACNSGSYTLTGTPASFILQRNYTAPLNAGSYALTGTPATFSITRFYALTCEAGNYALTGTNAVITSQYVMPIGSGSYSLTGTDADLTVKRNYTLECEAGSYTLTGTNVDLAVKRNYVLVCEAGSYSLTGTNAALTSSRTLVCESASGGAYPDIVVSGAGTTAVNGTYVYTAMVDSKPSFGTGGNIIRWFSDNGVWLILVEPFNYYYRSFDDVATPDLVTTWIAVDGEDPVPTVTAAPSLGYVLTGTDVTLTYTQGAQSYTLACEAGSFNLTGTDVSFAVQRNYSLICEAGSYSITGSDVGLFKELILSCEAGNYAITGTDADLVVQHNYTLNCETGSYSLTGSDADLVVQRNYILSCEAGSYSLTGTDTTLTAQFHYSLICEAGSYTLTGTDVTFGNTKSYTLVCASGSYALTGTDAAFELQRNYTLVCEVGSYALTGTDTNFILQRNYTLECETGSYSLTGTDVSFVIARNYTLSCDAGSYALTGSNVDLVVARSYTLSLDAGTYALTGTGITFALQRNYTLVCEAGTYSLTGSDVAFFIQRNYTLAMAAGSYSLTGSPVMLNSGRTLSLEPGNYALIGSDVGLFKGLVMPCSAGNYALTGSDISMTANYIFALGVGDYVLVGTNVGFFILSATPECRIHTIEHENRMYDIKHETRTHTIEHEKRTLEVKC